MHYFVALEAAAASTSSFVYDPSRKCEGGTAGLIGMETLSPSTSGRFCHASSSTYRYSRNSRNSAAVAGTKDSISSSSTFSCTRLELSKSYAAGTNTLRRKTINGTAVVVDVACTLTDKGALQEQGVTAYQRPDSSGRFGQFGGQYVPPSLQKALLEIEQAYNAIVPTEKFQSEFHAYLKDYVGRESPLYFAERLTEHYKRNDGTGGPHIYLKREDLNHTGAHKINNTIGQALLAKRMGKKRIVAETGAGQHGVATATVCARFGLDCVIYMGATDVERQALNVFRMKLLGATVKPVHSGTKTLRDAVDEAIKDWVETPDTTHYILGSVCGPHPFPMIVRDFQAVIGKETRRQALEKWNGKPDVLMACCGGGSNAMGLFHEFVEDEDVRLIGIEAAGEGVDTPRHAATLTMGKIGVLHGSLSYVLDDGDLVGRHSISAGLDYPGVGPEHSFLKDMGRAEYYSITDTEALTAFQLTAKLEGIIPALETAHALAYLDKLCPTLADGTKLVVNCSGRGDKDVDQAVRMLGTHA